MTEIKKLNDKLNLRLNQARSVSVCSHKASSANSQETVPKSLLTGEHAKVTELEVDLLYLPWFVN